MILFLIAAGSSGQTLDQLFSFLKTKNTDDFNSLYSDIIDREFLLGRSLFVFGQWCLARRLTLMPSLKESPFKSKHIKLVTVFHKSQSWGSSIVTFVPITPSPGTATSYQIYAADLQATSNIGAEVKIECRFQATSPRTNEQITFSVNRTTNKHGIYKLELAAIDGIECARENAIGNLCRASLIRSSNHACNVPGYKSTTDEITIKSQAANLCIYSLNVMNFRPSKTDIALCGN
uniref:Uncharacterized protein n=1 Tax=Daucus carota subsp. sativus TaxID=79200 RepID=A0A166G0F9_DAUCS